MTYAHFFKATSWGYLLPGSSPGDHLQYTYYYNIIICLSSIHYHLIRVSLAGSWYPTTYITGNTIVIRKLGFQKLQFRLRGEETNSSGKTRAACYLQFTKLFTTIYYMYAYCVLLAWNIFFVWGLLDFLYFCSPIDEQYLSKHSLNQFIFKCHSSKISESWKLQA